MLNIEYFILLFCLIHKTNLPNATDKRLHL